MIKDIRETEVIYGTTKIIGLAYGSRKLEGSPKYEGLLVVRQVRGILKRKLFSEITPNV